jgi:phosphoribosylglycinamide formyltransferase 2
VIKPVMSSSGKGQSLLKSQADVQAAWDYSQAAGRVGAGASSSRASSISTTRSPSSRCAPSAVAAPVETFFCEPIGHVQVNGDYVESWQPMAMTPVACRSRATSPAP